jgi:hypothetical protein
MQSKHLQQKVKANIPFTVRDTQPFRQRTSQLVDHGEAIQWLGLRLDMVILVGRIFSSLVFPTFASEE